MWFILLINTFFILTKAQKCKYHFSSPYGMKQFAGRIEPGENICINITFFDYFIVFNQAPLDTTIYEYRSSLNGSDLSLFSVYGFEQIDIYAHISSEFASQTITSAKGGFYSFAFGSLPDICKTGIIFTNGKYIESMSFSNDQEIPYKIGINDDICIVSTIPGMQSFSIDMQTEKCCDKLFRYQFMKAVDAFSGYDVDNQTEINATLEPVVFRFVSDSISDKSKSVKISMGTYDGEDPFEAGIVFYDPRKAEDDCQTEKCTFLRFFKVKIVLIVIASVIGIVVLFSAMFYFTSKCCCQYFIVYQGNNQSVENKDQRNIWPSSNVTADNRNEPQGYFALDPILRPNS